MSSECGICERDTRGLHAEDCPRYTPPLRCPCGGVVGEEWACETCGTDCSAAEATDTKLTGGTTMKHEFPIGARITLFATRSPIDDTTDSEDEHEFRDEPAVVVEHLNGDPAADYLVYVPRTRRVYPCVAADMAR